MQYEVADVLTLAAGLLQLAIAALIVRNVFGRARVFPWLVALAIFFLLRGATRLAEALDVAGGSVAWAALDGAVVIVLVAIVVGSEAISRLRLALEDAERTRDEYARALHDYRVLVRHRLATPITTIRGSASTLNDVRPLSERRVSRARNGNRDGCRRAREGCARPTSAPA
jgi:signal transduction histidine kinase